MLTFSNGGAHSQYADTSDADDKVAVLKLFYLSCPPTIVDEQCKMIVSVLI